MRVNKQIAALALSAVMGTSVFSAMPVMAAGTVQSAEASSSQEQSKVRKGPEDRISELVENGTISKETGEKISNYIKENRPEKKEKADIRNPLRSLLLMNRCRFQRLLSRKEKAASGIS